MYQINLFWSKDKEVYKLLKGLTKYNLEDGSIRREDTERRI